MKWVSGKRIVFHVYKQVYDAATNYAAFTFLLTARRTWTIGSAAIVLPR